MRGIQQRLITNAGVPDPTRLPTREERIQEGPPTQEDYERIVDALAYIRMWKVRGYGESRYDPEGARYNLSLAYGDMERKLIRVKNFVFSNQPLTEEVVSRDVAEAAADLANYAIMTLQICELLVDQGLCEHG